MSGTGHIVRGSPRRRVRLRVVTSRGNSLTVNVSAGGFCTGLMRVLPAGTHLEGLIHLDGQDAPFSGHVVWARPGNPRLSLMGTMGVRFIDVDPNFARNLEARDAVPPAPGGPGNGSTRPPQEGAPMRRSGLVAGAR
jgi:hypothetical protein